MLIFTYFLKAKILILSLSQQRCFVVPNTDVVEKNCCSTEDIQNCKVYARNRFETIDLDDYHLYKEGRDINSQWRIQDFPGGTPKVGWLTYFLPKTA